MRSVGAWWGAYLPYLGLERVEPVGG